VARRSLGDVAAPPQLQTGVAEPAEVRRRERIEGRAREHEAMATALLFVDVQRNMLEPPEPVPGADAVRAVLGALLDRARQAGAVVVHVQNDGSTRDPDAPGTPGWELVFAPMEGEVVVTKDQSDTFAANPSLAGELERRGVSRVVVAGMQSNYCIAATTRGALTGGFDVVLASGAHATYDEGKPASVISAEIEAALVDEGATAVPAPAVTFA
jgi:streptothricin hydrolase